MIDESFIEKNSTKSFLEVLLKEQAKEIGLEDLLQLKDNVKDPMVLSVLIFKLIEERKKTNQILSEINNKYTNLELKINNSNNNINTNNNENTNMISILCDTDEKITSFIREKGKAVASDIKTLLDYKGTNAASQRLNKLVKSKILTKVQSGRKVYFVLK
jgi:hypothetical protein